MLVRDADVTSVAPWLDVFTRFLRLGCTSFGGPVAHFGYFRREFVERAGWLDDAGFAEIVALCSVLPGPTSSQVGIVLGARRAGVPGAFLAWLAFTLPSALLLTAFGLALRAAAAAPSDRFVEAGAYAGALEGLAAAAAAVVLIAVIQLARNLLVTRATQAIGALSLILALAADRFAPAAQWAVLACGGIAGGVYHIAGSRLPSGAPPLALAISRRTAVTAGAIFVVLLAGLPIVAPPGSYLALFATFYRAGSLVFGGGHVVLPFLQSFIGSRISTATFFAGYGAAQAVPGPLFAFAAFAGAVDRETGGPPAALVALLGIYAPSFLLLAAALPLWSALRQLPRAGSVLAGVNAAVVGLLAAVLVDPIAMTLAHRPLGIGLALGAAALLQFARLPAWAVVLLSAGCGAAARALVHAA
jgi:chromate transporter